MVLTPLLASLSIACFALCLRNMAREEMVRIFAAIVSFLSLFAGLTLAPWFIQALLLIVILMSWRNPVVR
ncbi:hypothetical protein NIES30_25350 [Phormidium tenue NIES-30]|uniref:Uncharacterized protein n=1 Tax=Phormidium tenue NIES-30 TaxID=549789 RepID=A0A1U7IXZ7_9CYAN|nr:hypothetical protein NIES30_25350 [Phormidium tenue NIES-30]